MNLLSALIRGAVKGLTDAYQEETGEWVFYQDDVDFRSGDRKAAALMNLDGKYDLLITVEVLTGGTE